jgi:hypothetical protein
MTTFIPAPRVRVQNNSVNCPNPRCPEESLSLEWHINFNTTAGKVHCFQCETLIGEVKA